MAKKKFTRINGRLAIVRKPSLPKCQRCLREYGGHFDLCEVEVEPMQECTHIREYIKLPPANQPNAKPITHTETRVWWKKRKMFVCRMCLKQTDHMCFDLTREQRRQLRTRERH